MRDTQQQTANQVDIEPLLAHTTKCACRNNFSVKHALSCPKRGFLTIRHNEIRDITASLLTEVCTEVRVEPELQPVTPDQLNGASANSQDGARLDVSASGVWGDRYQKTLFDERVHLPPQTGTNNQQQLSANTKWRKKLTYQQRVQDV